MRGTVTGSPDGVVVRVRFAVRGRVQGTGFRPFVHRLATGLGLSGLVANTTDGVAVEVQGDPDAVEAFTHRLTAEAPSVALVGEVVAEPADRPDPALSGFVIAPSLPGLGRSGIVAPDVAMCVDCRTELADPGSRRHRHPFIACSACGPRYTIIGALPYDRASTAMARFAMCPACQAEYADPRDRRFHAQPIACPECGPQLRFRDAEDRTVRGSEAVLEATHRVLNAGGVVAVKGVGGYHLMCDATSPEAVGRLRRRKGRPDKPFAVLSADLEGAMGLADLGPVEIDALVSPVGPIVLAPRRVGAPLATEVAPGSPLVGVMVASNPLHALLFEPTAATVGPAVLVATSANPPGEPICADDHDALSRLRGLADAFVSHDRDILNPCDDSIVRVLDGAAVVLRIGRGLAPLELELGSPVGPTLAVGGHQKVTVALADDSRLVVSPHLGDQGSLDALDAFEAGIERLGRLSGIDAVATAVDAHPGYATTRWALARARPAVRVQHHHAHVAALAADHGLSLDRPLVAMAFDGSGLGRSDLGDELWGGEVLAVDAAGFSRLGSLEPYPLPGGESAVRNPCRTAMALLWHLGLPSAGLPCAETIDDREHADLEAQLAAGSFATPTTSVGRLLDAVASLLGVRHRITYDAQAAIELEHVADLAVGVAPVLPLPVDANGIAAIGPLVGGLVDAWRDGVPPPELARSVHEALARMIVALADRVAARPEAAAAARTDDGRLVVGLTGGVFQNALLVGLACDGLRRAGFEPLCHRRVPPNDGGLAVGQAVIAGHARRGHGGVR